MRVVVKFGTNVVAAEDNTVKNEAGEEICRGMVNYNSQDVCAIRGHHSNKIEEILGYNYSPTIIHRDNLVIL